MRNSLIALSLSITLVACGSDVRTYKTKGVDVTDEWAGRYGWTIDGKHMQQCLECILPFYPDIDIDGLQIFYQPYPFLKPDGHGESEFVYGTYSNYVINIGLQPYCMSTALSHELMHFYLEQKMGTSDPTHALDTWWEGGVVGEADKALRDAGL